MQLEVLFSIFLMAIGLGLSAQDNLSLGKAIEIGLENNYQIQIAERDVEIAQNNNSWGIAGRYPTVTASFNINNTYSFQNNRQNPAAFLRELSTVTNTFSPAIDANWIVFDGYRVKFTKQQLEEQERMNQGSVKIAVENTIQEIILGYYAALIQKEQLTVLEQVLELSRDRIEYQEVRKEFGQAGKFDILQAKDAYLNDSTNYLIQATTYENAFRSLNLAMGVDDLDRTYNLTDELVLGPESYELADLQTKMLSTNQSLINLQMARELAAVNTRVQESARYPSVSIGTGASYNSNLANGTGKGSNDMGEVEFSLDNVPSSTFNYYLNFGVSYNLFDGGVRKNNIQNAQVEELKSQLNIDDLKRNLNAQLSNTLATFNNQRNLVTLTQGLLDNARENLTISEERLKGGLINSFDYRSVQLAYINASQSRLNAIFNLKNTETELIKLIGGLVR